MSTGYKIADGRDLSDIFQSGNSGYTTNYKISNGTDLGQLFMAGNSGYTTNYKISDGRDLGSLFERKLPFTATGAQIYGTTAQDPNTGARYCYAIFTDTSNSSKTATIQQNYTSISITCVGGGGGGGGSSDTRSPGGGGGGAVQKVDLLEIPAGTVYGFSVGAGGAGGIYSINIGSGGDGFSSGYAESGVAKLICSGGFAGDYQSAGLGGFYSPGDIFTGSNGGLASAGQNCTYTNPMGDQYLDFPVILKNTQPTYICDLYAGGGGGTKTSSTTTSYSGGGGGQAPGGISNGIGGVRGNSNQAGTAGQNGQGWGSGGGAGGFTAKDTNFNGGAGKQGIIIIYSPIQ